MKKIKVSFEVVLPIPGPTDDEIREWIEYELGARGGISMSNLLSPYCLENCESVVIDDA